MVKTIKEMVELESRVKQLEAENAALKIANTDYKASMEYWVEEYSKVRAENTKLTEALKTIRDAGLEPIDPAYRELARAALEEGE